MAGVRTVTVRDTEGVEYRIAVSDGQVTVNDVELRVEHFDGGLFRVRPAATSDGNTSAMRQTAAYAISAGEAAWVFIDGRVYTFEVDRGGGRRKRSASAAGSLIAPMPATVRRIEVTPGERVRRGDILIVLEAMKMELPVRAPADGTLARVNCREGELVEAGQELAELQS